MDKLQIMNCHFCGKHKDEVSKLIQGEQAYICDGCIRLCYEIVQEEATKIGDYDVADGLFFFISAIIEISFLELRFFNKKL